MMMNLFSSFNPHSTLMSNLNWMSTLIFIFLVPNMFWNLPSRIMFFWKLMLNYLKKEMYLILKMKKNIILYISLFMFIMFNNFMGLFPYIFTSSSHLIFSLSFSLTLWISYMLFGWINNTNIMFSHLIPENTPIYLAIFMVLIETMSNIIRPKTLSIRLSANMIAGHMLLNLIGSYLESQKNILFILLLMTQSMLMILELSVAIIQAYVFSILTLIYSTETT